MEEVKVGELPPKIMEERVEAIATTEETTINIKEHQDKVEVEEERVMVKVEVEDTNLGLEEIDQRKENVEMDMEIGRGGGEDKSLIRGGIWILNEQGQKVKVKEEIKTESMDVDEAEVVVVDQGTTHVVDKEKAQQVKEVKTEIVDECEGNTEIVDEIKTENVEVKEATSRGHLKPKATFKKIECRVEIVEKVTRTFFCKLCMANVPSVSRLMVHLDREHNIRVNGPPRIVDDDGGDQKQDLENTSNLLKCIENEPRTCEPPSDFEASDFSDSDSVSSEDSGLDHDHYQRQTPEEIYLKRKEQLHNRMIKQDLVWKAKIKAQMDDPVFKVKMSNYTQCDICWVEHSLHEKFRLLRSVHKKQHADGDFKQCPHCSMHFLYEHYLDEHLQDMGVPVVPLEFSPSEAEDLLFQLHHCSFKDCNKGFTNRKCLLFHQTKEHDHKHYCPTCEKPFILYSALRKHIQRSHNWEKRMLKCPVPHCDKSFETRKGICIHGTHSHTKEEKELYIKNNVNFVNGEQTDSQTTCLPSVTADIRHQRPQTFWAIKSAQINYKSASQAKQNKIPGVREKATQSSTASSEPSMKINTYGINKSINQLSRPSSGPRPRPIVKRTSTSTSSETNASLQPSRIRRNYGEEIKSLPPLEYSALFSNMRRNACRSSVFSKPCSLCSRAFRDEADRNLHLTGTHKIDLSLKLPFHCSEGCGSYRKCSYLIRHIRDRHPPSVEHELLLRSLKEDKAVELSSAPEKRRPPKSLQNENGENPVPEVAAVEKYSPSDEEISHSSSSNNKQESTSSSVCQQRKLLVGPEAALIRLVLSKFTLDSRFYCPECPEDQRKLWVQPASTHQHMIKFHPMSNIIKSMSSVTPVEYLEGEEQDPNINDEKQKIASSSSSRQKPRNLRLGLHQKRSVKLFNKLLVGTDAAVVRSVLANFKIDNGFYCPECPAAQRKLMASTWSTHKHMVRFHPMSDIIKSPSSVKLEVLESTNAKENKYLLQEQEIEGEELDPMDEEGEELDPNAACAPVDNKFDGVVEEDPDDLITSKSDQSILSALRNYLQQFRISPDSNDDLTVTCPVCPEKEDGTKRAHSKISNLQHHILTQHPTCDLLRKSKLKSIIVDSSPTPMTVMKVLDQEKKPDKPLTRKFGLRGRVRRPKMKAKTNKPAGRRRVRRLVESKPMMSYLSTFRIGLKYYCPVCHSPESPRVYGYAFNVHRHIKNDHPHSELLTRNWAITLKKTNQKCKPQQQSTSESSASDEDVKVTVNDESESEIELDPRIEQADDNDVGGLSRSESESQGSPTSGKTKSSEEFRSKVNLQPKPSINTEPESEFKVKIEPESEFKVKIPESEFKVKIEPESEFKVKIEPETEYYICLKCPVESRWNYRSQWSLDRHINRKHGQQLLRQTEDEASNSSRDVDSNGSTTQSTSTATSLTTRSSRQRPQNSVSDTGSVSAINDLSSSFNAEEITFETILSHINLEKIQCPLCPEPKNKDKNIYQTTTHLVSHLNRSCPKAKSLNIIIPNRNGQNGLWTCKWCPRSFGSRAHLSIHFNKEHKNDVPKAELKDHGESIASKLQTCNRCGEFIKKLKDFKEHDCGLPTSVEVKKDSSPKKEWSSSSPLPSVRKEIKSEFGVDDSCPVPKVKVTAVSRPRRGSRILNTPRYKDSSSDDEFERLRPSYTIKREQTEQDQELRLPQVIKEEETSEFVCRICSKHFESLKAMSGHKAWHTRRNEYDLSKTDVDEPEKKRARLDLDDDEDDDNYLGEELDPDMEQELDPNQDNAHYNTDNIFDVSSQAQQSHNLSLDLEDSDPSALAADAESDLLESLDLLKEDPGCSVVESKCSYCYEFFDTPQAKVNHIIQAHSSRGRHINNGNEQA